MVEYSKARRTIRLSCVRIMTVFLCLVAQNRFSQALDLQLGHLEANRILFFGNSITSSPIWQNRGMAASAEDKDYVHVLTNSIAQVAGGTPSIMATYNAQFEQNYNTYNLITPLQQQYAALQPQLAFNPDIVVVAIGENVPTLTTPESQAKFASVFGDLLTTFKDNGNPAIFVRSSFWPNSTKDTIMGQVAIAAGAVFVDQSSIGLDASNRATLEDVGGADYSFAVGHPNDKGMKAIADSLFVVIAPEPGTLVLLGTAGLFGGGFAWCRRRIGSLRSHDITPNTTSNAADTKERRE